MPKCGVHGTEMVWKTGTSQKTGKGYAFWSCQTRDNGQFCQYKAPKEVTSDQKFNGSLERFSSITDQHAKDKLITRTAIAKELIAKGLQPDVQTFKTANMWFDWCMGKSVGNMVTPQE